MEPPCPSAREGRQDTEAEFGPASIFSTIQASTKERAFTELERDVLNLRGLLPPKVLTQDEQVEKVLESVRGETSDLKDTST